MITKEFKLSLKNQVTLPKVILDELEIGPGDPIYFEVKNHCVQVHPVRENKISALDLGKKFRYLVKKQATMEDIDKAINNGYRDLAGKNK